MEWRMVEECCDVMCVVNDCGMWWNVEQEYGVWCKSVVCGGGEC